MSEQILTIDEIRAAVAPVAEQYNIPAIFLFGSYARGTATANSDVDLVVDTTGTQLHGMFDLGMLYADLEESLYLRIKDLCLKECVIEMRTFPTVGDSNAFLDSALVLVCLIHLHFTKRCPTG